MSLEGGQPRILVVDDEEHIRRAMASILTSRQYDVHLAASGEEAVAMAAEKPPDLFILDLAMPGMDGFEVCRQVRTWTQAPILVLSVRSGSTDKISALDLGADDYMTKPFVAGELLARVRALLRRPQGAAAADTIHVDALEIDLRRRRVLVEGEEIRLTKTEFDILAFLARNADRVVTSTSLMEHIWGPDFEGSVHSLRVHVGNLRKKIEPVPSVPHYVITEPGVGYSFFTT